MAGPPTLQVPLVHPPAHRLVARQVSLADVPALPGLAFEGGRAQLVEQGAEQHQHGGEPGK